MPTLNDSNRDRNYDDVVLRCAWLVNPGEAPRQDVRLVVEDGCITEIGTVPPDELSLIQPVALLPQFVNAHTHLEFSQRSTPLPPPSPFPDWIASVIRYRVETGDATFTTDAIRLGLTECVSAGTGLVGEITTSEVGQNALLQGNSDTAVRFVSFRELIGFSADRITDQLAVAKAHVSAAAGNPRIVNALSPHAPYSVHPDLFTGIVDLAAEHDRPIAMHLAETREEVELLNSQGGAFVEFLKHLGIWNSKVLKPGTSAMDYLRPLSRLSRALAIHGNYLTSSEIDYVCRHPNVAIVYCPRTHAWFGHSDHPWQQLSAAGATVILGTDSRASNPDLSIWKELQHVSRQSAALPIWELLPMITTTAASAVGASADDYRLAVGGSLNAVTVGCPVKSETQLNQALLSTAATPQPLR